MKTVEEYTNLPCKMELIPDQYEGGFVVSFPELPGCLTVGDSAEEVIINTMDTKPAWFTAAIEDGVTINEPEELEQYSGRLKLRIPKSLYRQIAMEAKTEGLSMNRYCVCLLSKNILRAHKQFISNLRMRKFFVIYSQMDSCLIYGFFRYPRKTCLKSQWISKCCFKGL